MPLTEPPADELTFAVCTFQRVFDTYPAHDLLTLEELVFHLTRFELKPAVLKMIERDIQRAGLALEAFGEGRHRGGWHYSQLSKAAKAAPKAPLRAAREAHDNLVKAARKRAKQELRIWAPNLYREGATKRGTDGVEHVSCLVLDYDEGRRLDDARLIWEPYFHIGHTTWSHTEETHKFRVILPLASPVRAVDWPDFWRWADSLAGPGVDPSCKGVARAYALPVVPHAQWPRQSWVNRAPLLDPLSEGRIPQAAKSRPVPIEPEHPSWFASPDEDSKFIESGPAPDGSGTGMVRDARAREAAADDADSPWRLFDAPVAPTPRAKPAPAPSTPSIPENSEALDARVSALERRVRDLEQALGRLATLPGRADGLAARLERLHTLYEDGALTDDEYARAKAEVLSAES